jgi:predicted Fe-Mo cluster-binding NifX family protein
MKLAISSEAEGLQSALDPRFGRAKYFVVVDTDSGSVVSVNNSVNQNAAQGAGIQAGKTIVELGAKALITGHVGPKALAALQAGNIAVYTVASGTVADALAQFKAGKLKAVETADVGGHW